MENINNKIIELSNFVLGEIFTKKENKIKSTGINKIGYIITENNESFVYDIVDNNVIDLYSENDIEKLGEGIFFGIVNRPWESSNKSIKISELDEIIEILKKRASEIDGDKTTTPKYTKKEKNKNEINSEYEIMLSRKIAHQKRLINSKTKKAYKYI